MHSFWAYCAQNICVCCTVWSSMMLFCYRCCRKWRTVNSGVWMLPNKQFHKIICILVNVYVYIGICRPVLASGLSLHDRIRTRVKECFSSLPVNFASQAGIESYTLGGPECKVNAKHPEAVHVHVCMRLYKNQETFGSGSLVHSSSELFQLQPINKRWHIAEICVVQVHSVSHLYWK